VRSGNVTVMPRAVWTAILMCLIPMAFGQSGEQQIAAVLNSIRPDAIVTVKKHSSGADVVEVTMLDGKYPQKLLADQVMRMGLENGTGIRGLQVYTTAAEDPQMRFVKASFATDDLVIGGRDARLRLQPIVRAFAGGPESHRIGALIVQFAGQKPTERTINTFRSDSVVLAGRVLDAPFEGLEYRVALLSQDPTQIAIPDFHDPQAKKPEKKPEKAAPSSETPVLRFVLLGVAALAAGALVYFVVRSGRSRSEGVPNSRRYP